MTTGRIIQSLQISTKTSLTCSSRWPGKEPEKSPSDLLPFIMNAASQGRNAGLNFNSNEINTIIEVLKMGKSPRERAKLDKVVNLMKMMK